MRRTIVIRILMLTMLLVSCGSDNESVRLIPGPAGKDGQSIKGDKGDPGESIVGPRGPAGESIIGPAGDSFMVFAEPADVATCANGGFVYTGLSNGTPVWSTPICNGADGVGTPGSDGMDAISTMLTICLKRRGEWNTTELNLIEYIDMVKARGRFYHGECEDEDDD